MRGSIAVVVAGSAVPVFALERGRCWTAAKGKWLDTVKARIAELGYVVRAIKSEGGRYEIEAVDFNGARIELHINPKTGTLVKPDSRGADRSREAWSQQRRRRFVEFAGSNLSQSEPSS